jgi:hypothetical protein
LRRGFDYETAREAVNRLWMETSTGHDDNLADERSLAFLGD